MITPMNILDAREDRANLQEQLIDQYKNPLLVIRVNYPGIDKNNLTTKYTSEIIFHEITKNIPQQKIINIHKIDSYEGLIFILSISLDPKKIKKISIFIENKHPLGRLVDLDVIDTLNCTLSRVDFNEDPRLCFICQDKAHNCVRSRKHKLEDTLDFIENKVSNYKLKGSENNV